MPEIELDLRRRLERLERRQAGLAIASALLLVINLGFSQVAQ